MDQPKKNTDFWFGITNPKWLSIKAQFFILGVGLASFAPYAVIFYQSLGLTTAQIGVIEFLNVIIGVVSSPVIGAIADKTGRHSFVVAICTIGFLVPISCFMLFSTSLRDQYKTTLTLNVGNNVELKVCNHKASELLTNSSTLFITSKSNTTADRLVCKDLGISDWLVNFRLLPDLYQNNCSLFQVDSGVWTTKLFPRHDESLVFSCNIEFLAEAVDNTVTFYWICLLRAIAAISLAPTIALTDSITYLMLGPDSRGLWGQQRMFAALGWGMGASMSGVLIDRFQTFRISFTIFSVLSATTVLTALFWLPRQVNQKAEDGDNTKKQKQLPFGQTVRAVLVSPVFCITCVVAIASGMLLSVFQVIWPQHIATLEAPKVFVGLAALVICAFELPCFFFAGHVVSRIGEPTCFLLMFLAYTIRYGVNSLLTPATVWLALPMECLHIFCFALFFAAATCIAATIAPARAQSTVQALISTSYSGIGTGSGVVVFSLIFEKFSHNFAFFLYSMFAFASFLILLVIHFAFLRMAVTRMTKCVSDDEVVRSPNDKLITTTYDKENEL